MEKKKVELAENEEAEESEMVAEEAKRRRKKKKEKKKKKDTVIVKVDTLSEHPDKVSPIVGYFPSGFDPLEHRGGGDDESPPKVKVFRHQKRTNRLQLVIRPNDSPVDFVGTNYSGEAATPQVCTYALGVLDKESQTLKIVPIASNKIFRLEPRVGGSDMPEKEPCKGDLTAESKADKMKDLTLMYSTKKSISQAKKLESLYQKDDPETQEDLDRKIKEIKINKEALEIADSYNTRNIPPYDSSATTPQMAYPLDKIILTGEWDYLLDILELSQVGQDVASDVYPSFVCNRVHRLEYMEDDAEKKSLACVFSYITHLIKFKDKHSLEGFSAAKYHKVPSILFQKFSTMFADSDTKRLQEEKKDLLISYVLVLTLIADDFRTDPTDIAKDLRMTAMKLRPHFEHLGGKLVRQGTLLLATLPVPLEFPKPRGKRKRR